jgi:hypothetical protein
MWCPWGRGGGPFQALELELEPENGKFLNERGMA